MDAIGPGERRRAAGLLAAAGLLGDAVYSVLGTWSSGRGFGGIGADGGWIDDAGRPTTAVPMEAVVTGRPAGWVVVLLAAALVAGHLWASRSDDRAVVRRRYRLTLLAATALTAAAAVGYTALAMHLVDQAWAAGSAHPILIGDADLVLTRVTAG